MKFLHLLSILLLIVILLVMGYVRERYLLVFDSQTIFTFINKYPRVAITNYQNEMQNFIGFKLSPKLTSAILYSLFFTLNVSLIAHLIIKEKLFTRFVVLLYGAYMVLCFLLILLGSWGVDYHLSIGVSHYLEDLFLSPFILMFLLPIIIFKKKQHG